MLDAIGYKDHIVGKRILENSCGEGNILQAIVKRYIEDAKRTGLTQTEIKKGLECDIIAYEKDRRLVRRCRRNLNKVCREFQINDINWNIKKTDYLKNSKNEKKVDFDKEYIEQLYLSYFESKDSIIDDFNKVKNIFKGKNVIMICPGKTSETHYNKLASLNLEDYVLVSINFEYKLHPVDYLFVGNSRRMKEIRKDLYKKVIASSNVPSGNVFAKINYSSLLNKTEYVKDNSGLMFLKLLSMCDVNSVKIIGMDGYLHKHDDNYISDDLMFVLEEDIAEQINLGVKLEIKKLKKELSIEII